MFDIQYFRSIICHNLHLHYKIYLVSGELVSFFLRQTINCNVQYHDVYEYLENGLINRLINK